MQSSEEQKPLINKHNREFDPTNLRGAKHVQGRYATNRLTAGKSGSRYPSYSSTSNSSSSSPGSSSLGTIPEDTPLPDTTYRRRSYLAEFQETPIIRQFNEIRLPRGLVTVILSVLCVLFLVSNVITIPLYTQATVEIAHSDPYIAYTMVCFWLPFVYFGQLIFIKVFIDHEVWLIPRSSWLNIFLAGSLFAMQGIFLSFSSLPERTPPYMQPVLMTAIIPFTVLARLVMLRKGINRKQLVCLIILFIGIFITLEPAIFGVDMPEPDPGTTQGAWYYPIFYTFSYLPFSIALVIIEKDQHGQEAQFMVYVAWMQVAMFASTIALFWTDFIPGFGMTKSLHEFFVKFKRGYSCFYLQDSTCTQVPGYGIIFIFSYSFGNQFANMLIKYSSGAIYSVLVQVLVTPVATLFWTFFTAEPSFHWAPLFNLSTVFIVVGLVIMVPSIMFYTYFTDQPRVEPTELIVSDEPEEISATDTITRNRSAPQLSNVC